MRSWKKKLSNREVGTLQFTAAGDDKIHAHFKFDGLQLTRITNNSRSFNQIGNPKLRKGLLIVLRIHLLLETLLYQKVDISLIQKSFVPLTYSQYKNLIITRVYGVRNPKLDLVALFVKKLVNVTIPII